MKTTMLCGVAIVLAVNVCSGQDTLPRVFLLDANHLEVTRHRLRSNVELQDSASLRPALAALLRDANEALRVGPFSVVDKDVTPPSGDKHDFMSQGPYWWPNPDTPDGLPYVRRDGQRNPEIYKLPDDRHMSGMADAVQTLSLAWYFTGEETYAARSARLLRTWFLDPPTRMNPNLQYGQGIPGITTGRGVGLIDSVGLTRVVDAVGLLAGSEAWMAADQTGLQSWFAEFLQWMLESKYGRDEAAAKNNHGTYYDLQVASYALFVGRRDVAMTVLREVAAKRIARQIEPDGRQPLELERTKSWGYSLMNLRGLMSLAQLGESTGVNLWDFQTADGRSIRKALDYLLPFALGERRWPHEQIGSWSPREALPLVRQAAVKYPDGPYRSLALKAPALEPNDRTRLLRPDVTGLERLGERSGATPVAVPDAAAASAVPDAHLDYTPGQAPRFWSVATAETIMARWPDYKQAYHAPWTYVHGYSLYGFDMLHRATGDKKYFDYIKRYIDQFVDEKGNFLAVGRGNRDPRAPSFTNQDNMMTGNTLVMLYEYTKDERYKTAATTIRRALDDYPRNSNGGLWHARGMNGQWWIDGIFMSQMFLTRYGKSVGDTQDCWDEATLQLGAYARSAQRDNTGLYLHGIFEAGHGGRVPNWADPNGGLSPEVWSEGLGWYALVLVETLTDLPDDHAKRAEMEDIFHRLAAGLKRTQDPKSGRWFQVVDKGDQPDNWTDTSGSAMFTYTIQKGIEIGLLDKAKYAPAVEKGYKGITGNAKINDRGLVDIYSACDGLGVQRSYEQYVKYKQSINAKEAVAGFLWATAIVEWPELEKLRR